MGWLTTAPWRRAPALLLRTPGVFLACVAAAGVLGTAAASGVLFLSSTGTAALHNEAALVCPEAGEPAITAVQDMYRLTIPARSPAGLPAADRAIRGSLRSAGLPAPDLVATSYASIAGARTDTVMLFAREGSRQHVDLLTPSPGPGVLVPQSFATAHGLGAGSTLALGAARVRVAGVFRDLAPSAFDPAYRLPRYWCTWHDQVVPGLQSRPPPMLLADLDTVRAAALAIDVTWYVPRSAERSTVPQSRALLARTEAALAATPGQDQLAVKRDLGYLLNKAERERDGLGGAVLPIDIAGTLVAAVLVAGSGTFWGLRRQRELRLLSSRGVSRFALGVKAVLETAPAIALGTLAGWVLAIGLVRTLGPSAQLEPGVPATALGVAAVAGAASLVAVGVLGATAIRADRTWRHGAWLRRVPWELALLAASALTYQDVRRHGAVRIVNATVHVNPLVLAFPLLALTGAVLLLARGGVLGLRRARPGRLPRAAYLAFRRLAGTPAVAVGALVGVAVPIGVLVYSAALSGSTAHDVQRKYETNVGAPLAFGTLAAPGSTPDLHGNGTLVSMIQVDPHLPDGTQVRVLGLDPGSFGRYAFQAGELGHLIARLGTGTTALDALLVNAPQATSATAVDIRGERIALHVVGRSESFPGLRDPFEPLLVVNRAALPAQLPVFTDRMEELWTDPAHEGAALAALRAAGVDATFRVSPATFLDSTGLRPVTWLFGYLRALAYLTGAVAMTALAFAFTARTRRRALSYYLARRMGLSRAGHRRSIAVELGSLLALSWACGVGLAVGAVGLVYRLTDAYPKFPPPPHFPLPVQTIAVSAALTLLVGLCGTALLQRLLDRVPPGDLLRA